MNVGYLTIQQQTGGLIVRNHTTIANYDRSYQNFVPGAVSADQSQVALTAYNNATNRTNLFNQTDFTYATTTGGVRHTLLAGVEAGRQLTDNFRNTGFFNNTATSISIPFSVTMITTPVTFRQSATDADNHLRTNLAAVYAQDQMELSRHVQLVGGIAVRSLRSPVSQQSQRRHARSPRQPGLASGWSGGQAGGGRCRSTPAMACRICRAQAISFRR